MFQIIVLIIGIILSLSGIFYSFYEKHKQDTPNGETSVQVEKSDTHVIRFK